ncbi:hypothetical protein BJ508DRAFT_376600 [Ascobolus immersus RN42]|uniref:Uncharacterized protein n=1 Tax=Ascobolus immersus RN42 TaxID=1160509 RepID=A0A3N4I5A4_ASCIM|nr:hypothetical protein BJ508DRAFT_376600 [Ascobolus immersus RN42]
MILGMGSCAEAILTNWLKNSQDLPLLVPWPRSMATFTPQSPSTPTSDESPYISERESRESQACVPQRSSETSSWPLPIRYRDRGFAFRKHIVVSHGCRTYLRATKCELSNRNEGLAGAAMRVDNEIPGTRIPGSVQYTNGAGELWASQLRRSEVAGYFTRTMRGGSSLFVKERHSMYG